MSDTDMDQQSRMRVVFDRLAADYDVRGPGCFSWFGRRLVEESGIEVGGRVLDVACGRGAVMFPALERVGSAGCVVGIDLSASMARLANEEARLRGYGSCVQVMDAERLGFPDATFDAVLCGFGVMFFPNLDETLAEFRRVLKGNGRLAISSWQVSQAHDLNSVLNDLGLGGRVVSSWINDAGRLEDLLWEAFFSDVRVIADTHVFRYDDVEQYWQTARATGLRHRLEVLNDDQAGQVRRALADRLKQYQRGDGLYIAVTALLAFASR